VIGEFLDLGFPLVFDGGGRNHQRSCNSLAAAQEFGGSQRLHRFPQAHVVGQNHPAPASRE